METKLPGITYEHIFVDNQSLDKTVERIKKICLDDRRVKLLVNSKNAGAPKSIFRALEECSGETIVPMLPADLQDPPEVIEQFYQKFQEGYKVVFGRRATRDENLALRIFRALYYKIIQIFGSGDLQPDVAEFLLADRQVIRTVIETKDHYPYLRGLIAQTDCKSTVVDYHWVRRKNGKSKASVSVLIDQALNGFISMSRIPARIILLSGLSTSLLSFLFGIGTIVSKIFFDADAPQGISTIVILIVFFGGLQMLILGLIGEYVLSINSQVRQSPKHFFIEKINFK